MALLKKPATMTWGQWARSERAKAIAEHPELQEQPGKEKKCMDCPRLRHIALLRPGGVYKWGPRCGEHKLVFEKDQRRKIKAKKQAKRKKNAERNAEGKPSLPYVTPPASSKAGTGLKISEFFVEVPPAGSAEDSDEEMDEGFVNGSVRVLERWPGQHENPDAAIPLPEFQWGTTKPFPKDSHVACSNERRMKQILQEYDAEHYHITPTLAFCNTYGPDNNGCGKELSVYRDRANFQYNKDQNRITSEFGWKGLHACNACDVGKLNAWKETGPEDDHKRHDDIGYLRQTADSLLGRVREREDEEDAPYDLRFDALVPHSEKAGDLALSFLLEVAKQGRVSGEELGTISYNLQSKSLVAELCENVRNRKCVHCTRPLQIRPEELRAQEMFSPDRRHSQLKHTHPDQEVLASCLSCNFLFADLDDAGRARLKRIHIKDPSYALADAAITVQSSFYYDFAAAEDKKPKEMQRQIIRTRVAEAELLGWDRELAIQTFDSDKEPHFDDIVRAQGARPARKNGKRDVGHRYSYIGNDGNQREALERRNWKEDPAPRKDFDEQWEQARLLYIAGGGVDQVSGAKVKDGDQIRRLSFDRMFNTDLYSPETVLLMSPLINTCKATMYMFNDRDTFMNDFLPRNPLLQQFARAKSLKHAVVKLIRAELFYKGEVVDGDYDSAIFPNGINGASPF